ncbi:hypothetical protein PR202_gb22249 [Eleusine coracana subsp. coracana]|uniref:Uncharacterized protein n=1 Tax=Eleusine coracana subsp. coracana TaxID=191504 RepID=A0AAV5FD35_ELECO|nr:hypothetical protein PR202_gb22249 [Eleusine coracana subsp. coracana]
MEIVRSHRQLAAAAAAGGGGSGTGGLPTYRTAPQLEVRLEEFELFAIDRLRGAISMGFLPSRIGLISPPFHFSDPAFYCAVLKEISDGLS